MKWRVAALLLLFMLSVDADQARAWLGFGFTYHRQLSDKGEVTKGWMIIRNVAPDGPASKAGLAPGDVVVSINRTKFSFRRDLDVLRFLGGLEPGRYAQFIVIRSGRYLNLKIVPTPMTDAQRASWSRYVELAEHRGF